MKLAIGNFIEFGTKRNLPGGKAHYMIYKGKGPTDEDGFISVCLEYAQMTWDKSKDNSLKKLIHQVQDYLETMDKAPDGHRAIFSLIGQGGMEEYWGIYRQLVRLHRRNY